MMRPFPLVGAKCTLNVTMAALLAFSAAACREAADADFGPAREVHAGSGPGATPVVAVAQDGRRAMAWIVAPDGGSDGRLAVSIDHAEPILLSDPLGPASPHGEAPPKLAWDANGKLHAMYVVSRLVPGRRFPASALRLTSSSDGGLTWNDPVTVTDDDGSGDDFGSHNFHALHAASDGSLYAAWLDGRSGVSGSYISRSTDGGRTWSPDVRIAEGESCPCCRTAIATAPDGTLYVAWRTVLPGSIRDIVVASSIDGGATWRQPVRVYADDWMFDACPHAGPSLQVDDTGRLHAAWWTGKEGVAGVWYAHSDDGARTFSTPLALGAAEFSRPAHVQLALAGAGRVIAVWDDGTVRVPRVTMRMSRDSGRTFGPPIVLSDEAVAATFPVMGVHGDSVSVLWAQMGASDLEHADHSRPDMRDPSATMGLPTVGASQVIMREGLIR
jgi:hypothetical protein